MRPTHQGTVMIGHQAGMNETGDDRLYISNSSTNDPLIYGEFDGKKLKTNGHFEATGKIKIGDDTNSATPGTIRYNTSTKDFEGWNGFQWLSLTRKTAEYGPDVTDIDGNFYRTVKIGEQLWMAQNLKVTTYNDGTNIQNITDNATWNNLNTGAWCYYDNDSNYDDDFGKLYNWYAVDTEKLCPSGWHVPSRSEFSKLILYLGYGAGAELKEAGTKYWNPPNHGANNSSGFTGRPGGNRNGISGSFSLINSYGFFWTTSLHNGSQAFIAFLLDTDARAWSGFIDPFTTGHSIRCLKD